MQFSNDSVTAPKAPQKTLNQPDAPTPQEAHLARNLFHLAAQNFRLEKSTERLQTIKQFRELTSAHKKALIGGLTAEDAQILLNEEYPINGNDLTDFFFTNLKWKLVREPLDWYEERMNELKNAKIDKKVREEKAKKYADLLSQQLHFILQQFDPANDFETFKSRKLIFDKVKDQLNEIFWRAKAQIEEIFCRDKEKEAYNELSGYLKTQVVNTNKETEAALESWKLRASNGSILFLFSWENKTWTAFLRIKEKEVECVKIDEKNHSEILAQLTPHQSSSFYDPIQPLTKLLQTTKIFKGYTPVLTPVANKDKQTESQDLSIKNLENLPVIRARQLQTVVSKVRETFNEDKLEFQNLAGNAIQHEWRGYRNYLLRNGCPPASVIKNQTLDPVFFQQRIYSDVVAKVHKFAESPVIGKHRNLVKQALRASAGILFLGTVVPLLVMASAHIFGNFVSWFGFEKAAAWGDRAWDGYRNFFFNTKTQAKQIESLHKLEDAAYEAGVTSFNRAAPAA